MLVIIFSFLFCLKSCIVTYRKPTLIKMSDHTLLVPPLKEMRVHILTCLLFVSGYFELVRTGKGIGKATDFLLAEENILCRLTELISSSDMNKEILLGPPEICVIYACCDMMNKLLLTATGELLSRLALEKLPHNHPLKDFIGFRYFMIKVNTQMLQNIETTMPDSEGLIERKRKLSTFGL